MTGGIISAITTKRTAGATISGYFVRQLPVRHNFSRVDTSIIAEFAEIQIVLIHQDG